MELYHYFPGTLPVLINVPHSGTYVPDDMLERFTPPAKQLRDTDWHVDRLYDFARALGVHMLVATHSRYVIDLNRDPGGESLYPGKFTTGLCPTVLFDKTPIYNQGQEPADAEVTQRTGEYWQPYHDKLQTILDGLKQKQADKNGRVVLFDAHSIASQVPLFFEGRLPDLNLGSADGASADAALMNTLLSVAQNSPYSSVLNGRFKGGYITRHYGRPDDGVHGVQLELSQVNYMEETYPFTYLNTKARHLQGVLHEMVTTICEWVSA